MEYLTMRHLTILVACQDRWSYVNQNLPKVLVEKQCLHFGPV